MDIPKIICSQYLASLAMLKQAIEKCPASLWDAPEDKTKFWHVAYHALFYAHLYLQPTLSAFVPWAKHRPEHHRFSQPGDPSTDLVPYTQEEVLEYAAFCHQQVDAILPQLDLEGPSGFEWLPFNKLELQIYNIRHIQQHAGELMERLGTRANIDVDWVGRG